MTRCSGINKTTGTQCKSRADNCWGTCRRHSPSVPTEEEYAAALTILNEQPARQPPATQDWKSITLEELKVYKDSIKAFIDSLRYPEFSAHSRLLRLSTFLKIENEFTKKMLEYAVQVESVEWKFLELGDRLAERKRWASLDEPLASTLEGLKQQSNICGMIYADVECADQGYSSLGGYQFWQINALETIAARILAINAAIKELQEKA